MIIFFFFFFLIPFSQSLNCINCRKNNTHQHCMNDCEGDYCGVWRWNEEMKQGCISLNSPIRIGCRTNQAGATLCICNDSSQCNTQHRSPSTVPTLPIVRLPSVDCVSIAYPNSPHEDDDDEVLIIEHSHSCHSDYCHFTKIDNFIEHEEDSIPYGRYNISVAKCSIYPQYEFDIRINSNPFPRGLTTNFCYRLRSQRNSAETNCICSTKKCNDATKLASVSEGPIQCYMVSSSRTDSTVNSSSLCYGDLCFIIRSEDGEYSKGCLSISSIVDQPYTIHVGNRSIFGEDQWYCNQQLCNMDISRLSRSLSHKSPSIICPFNSSSPLFIHYIILYSYILFLYIIYT